MIELNTEVAIIGSGFGGAVAASRLVDQGVAVVMLERGPWRNTRPVNSMNVRDHAELPRRSFSHLLRNGVMAVCHHRWSWDHEWAHMAGIPEEELAHIEQMDPEGFERHKWIAISYVRAYVSGKFGNVPKELRREMRNNYTAHEIKEIELVARIMDIGNRGANTWDAMLSRLKGNPAADSHILDEAVLSGA